MSIFQPDLILGTALQVAIADIRKKRFLLEDAFSELKNDKYLKNLYGEKEIERFVKFIQNEIYIVLEHRPLEQAKFPCVAISIGGGQEDSGREALSDSYTSETVDSDTLSGAYSEDKQLLGPVNPLSFDSLTGQITFSDKVNLSDSEVYDGHYVYDSVNKKFYQIELVLDDNNLLIEAGQSPNLKDMAIYRTPKISSGNVKHTKRSIWYWETHTFRLYSTDATELLYLFTLIIYVLNRYKKDLLDARNYQLSTYSYGEIYRASSPDDPNALFARDITLRGRVEHSYIENTSPILDGIIRELKIGVNGEELKTDEGLRPIVEKQGWKMEGDE